MVETGVAGVRDISDVAADEPAAAPTLGNPGLRQRRRFAFAGERVTSLSLHATQSAVEAPD